ncbi:MAG: hypothetical protein HYZ53_05845 [Planctomycetes bacterium]|nr:hypothetical protein [Planctomycetota bacterium]
MPVGMDVLKEIQQIDLEIHRALKGKKERPAVLARETQEMERRKKAQEAKALELKGLKAEAEAKEKQDLAEKTDRITRLGAGLNQAKSNKEYAAITAEINSVKSDRGLIEEQVLVLMNKVEACAKELEELKRSCGESEKALEEARRQVEAELVTIEQSLEGLREKRKGLTGKVDGDLLKVYERIQKNKADGVALAAVVDGCCQGCHMGLTSQDVNLLLRGKDTILCRSCNRITYIG